MKIYYGTDDYSIDVTDLAIMRFKSEDGIVRIPAGDGARADVFGDPVVNVEKKVYVHHDTEGLRVFDINTATDFWTDYTPPQRCHAFYHERIKGLAGEDLLRAIHNIVYFTGGGIRDEYPEQLMAALFLHPSARVLELGSNIGRNTITIATILDDDRNLVTLETDPGIASILKKNRDDNGFRFQIVNAALSARPLIQDGWNSRPLDGGVMAGFMPAIVSFDGLQERFGIEFDTLIIDCEGAFYYILQDFPSLLDNIRLIIMENDYNDVSHKQYVDARLVNSGFTRVYVRGEGGWGPCADVFFETWTKA